MDPRIVHALEAIAHELHNDFLPLRLVDWAQVLLALLTAGTLVLLWKYTAETVKLRKAASDQVEVSNQLLTQAQIQNKRSLMPIVVFGTGRHEIPDGYKI